MSSLREIKARVLNFLLSCTFMYVCVALSFALVLSSTMLPVYGDVKVEKCVDADEKCTDMEKTSSAFNIITLIILGMMLFVFVSGYLGFDLNKYTPTFVKNSIIPYAASNTTLLLVAFILFVISFSFTLGEPSKVVVKEDGTNTGKEGFATGVSAIVFLALAMILSVSACGAAGEEQSVGGSFIKELLKFLKVPFDLF